MRAGSTLFKCYSKGF